MKIDELRQKSREELEKSLQDSREKLRQLRFDLSAGKVKNVREIRRIKKEIARILTLVTELPKEAKVKMKTKFSFASEKNWEKIFKEIGLNVIFKKRINNFLIKKGLFVLEASK